MERCFISCSTERAKWIICNSIFAIPRPFSFLYRSNTWFKILYRNKHMYILYSEPYIWKYFFEVILSEVKTFKSWFSLENYTSNNATQHDTTRVQHNITEDNASTTRHNASTTQHKFWFWFIYIITAHSVPGILKIMLCWCFKT